MGKPPTAIAMEINEFSLLLPTITIFDLSSSYLTSLDKIQYDLDIENASHAISFLI